MKIKQFDTDKKVLIVAEIGNNHEGRIDVAQKLVTLAEKCGVDAVKFQTFRAERFVRQVDAERFARLKSFELPEESWGMLSRQAKDLGLLFLSTPLDLGSADLLRDMVDAYKIASGDLTFFPLIERVAASGKPLIFSSGMADIPSVQAALACAESVWKRTGVVGENAVLHCVSAYPTPREEANLLSIPYLAANLSRTIGYSDHVMGIEASVAAVAMGARVLEKHFTMDKNFSTFRDHRLSADPEEMKVLVSRVRDVERMRGHVQKRPQPAEAGSLSAFRRSIAAGRDLKSGCVLTFEDLTWLRPAGGLNPGEEGRLVGHRLRREVSFGEYLAPSDVEDRKSVV